MIALLFLYLLADGPPYYTRPVDPVTDMQELERQLARGTCKPEPWRIRLQLYTNLGELQTIPQLIDRLAQHFPDEPVFQESRMILLSLDKKHDQAIAVGLALLERFPTYPTIRANLARAYFNAGQRVPGINRMFEAMQTAPIRVEDWKLLLENLAAGTPDPEVMVATLRRKCEQNPQITSLQYTLMVVLTRLGRYAEARDILRKHPQLADHQELKLFLDQEVDQ